MSHAGQATLGIVLAGGGSTRLGPLAEATGGGKASLELHGRTFLGHVLAAVTPEVGRTIVVAAPGQRLPAVGGAAIVRDTVPGAGPLSGVCDGMRSAVAAARPGEPPGLVFVASCDVPLLRRQVVRLLVDVATAADAVWTVPIVGGHRQVLVSVMRVDILPRIEAWLAAGRRDLRGLLTTLAQDDPRHVREVTEAELATVDPALESFVDIDTPDDLQRLQSR